MRISLDWIKDFVKVTPPFEGLADRLTMAGLEVKKIHTAGRDTVFEIEITSNRPDWLSHLGVAREVAAIDRLSLQKAPALKEGRRKPAVGWQVTLKDPESCPYYTGVLIEGIQWAATPEFILKRLESCGCRSVNLIVDITNYVLYECGQPLHAFDADSIEGREIIIRTAKENEKFVAINQTEILCSRRDLLIADKTKPLALAGIMGGIRSETTTKTRNVFLESAFFAPRKVRVSSKAHGISSESSYRFERRVDPNGVDYGMDRALALIEEYASPRFMSSVLQSGEKPVQKVNKIHLKASDISRVLGTEIRSREILSILTRLGFETRTVSELSWAVDIPSYRPDLEQPVDLVEEVARIYGYDSIPESLPSRAPISLSQNQKLAMRERARDYFVACGLNETVTFSIISESVMPAESKDSQEWIRVNNPLHHDLNLMRPTLIPSAAQVVQHNQGLGNINIGIFEIANTYRKKAEGKQTCETCSVVLALSGKFRMKNWVDTDRDFTFFDLKGLFKGLFDALGVKTEIRFQSVQSPLFEPAVSESVYINQSLVGELGAIHPIMKKKWGVEGEFFSGQLFLDGIAPEIVPIKIHREISKFPPAERDLSVTVPESLQSGEIQNEIRRLGGKLVMEVELFDLFRGGRIPAGHKNLAFRVTYQSFDRTLVSEEVQTLHSCIGSELVKKYQVSFQ